ncbi:MAG: MG2 domain-containing protein [Gammaproteobacteria bacterium]|nr:MG2 domain-containing protein [Gammaproteobacteria bacterium]
MKQASAVLALILATLVCLSAAGQESPLPDRRGVAKIGEDLIGPKVDSIEDTGFHACWLACGEHAACAAFTFDFRERTCLLKSSVDRTEPREGFTSVRMVETVDAQHELANKRLRDLDYLSEDEVAEVRDLARDLGSRVAATEGSLEALKRLAAAAEDFGNMRVAAQHLAVAAMLSDSSEAWLDLSRVLAKTEVDSYFERLELANEALFAAVNAYLRTDGRSARATALVALARRLEDRQRGDDMISALRLSQRLAPRRSTRELLDHALDTYGFRLVEHRVDDQPVIPRLCLRFSEELRRDADYAPYVRIRDHDRLPVEAEGNQLCVGGLRHGQRYELLVRAGLPSSQGERLRAAHELQIYVRDRPPSVRFKDRAYVLPKSVGSAIPVVTVNVDELAIAIYRIGPRNLVTAIRDDLFDRPLTAWAEDQLGEQIGEPVWAGVAEVSGSRNEEVTTRLPMDEVVREFEPGVYAVTARLPTSDERWAQAATQWFVVTDLAVASMSAAEGVHGFVRALSTAEPVAGAKVRLVAVNNDVLGEALSDEAGYVRFDPGLTRGVGGAAPALLEVQSGGDFTFLDLAKPGFDLSDRGVQGRPAPGPVDVFAATDRGVYRPGEVVRLTVLARDARASGIELLPLTLVATRPDGVEYLRTVLDDQGAGGRTYALALGSSAPRGTWTVRLHADPEAGALAKRTFLVEDFVPERIELDLAAAKGMIDGRKPFSVALQARYLYGPSASGLPITGEVRVRTVRALPGYPGFSFGLADEEAVAVAEALPSSKTDDFGKAELVLPVPASEAVSRPLEMTVGVQVTDSSSRPVERTLTRTLLPGGIRLGIRPLFDDQADVGGLARFEVIAIDADGRKTSLDRVDWSLSRVTKRWQWYYLNRRWNWEPVTERTQVANGEVALADEGRVMLEAAVERGVYELRLTDAGDGLAAASLRFNAGWHRAEGAPDTPDILPLGLDKRSYRVGESVSLRLLPRHAGKIRIAVVNDQLVDVSHFDVAQGETVVQIPVSESWGTGAYVSATLVRPLDSAAGRGPTRAIGLAWVAVEPGAQVLDVALSVPATAVPRGSFDADLLIAGLPPGETAYVTVSAVDLGILNLTEFETPNPERHYFGQRALGVEMRDLYGRLIQGGEGHQGRMRSGGDEQLRLPAMAIPGDVLMAEFSGLVEVGADGGAVVPISVPDFNGSVRVTALAWTKTAVGSASEDVIVRDPIVVAAALPRFLALGDSSRLGIDVAHGSGPAGLVQVRVEADSGLAVAGEASQAFELLDGERKQLSFPIRAVAIGDPQLRISTLTPDGGTLLKTVTLPVRRNDPEVVRSTPLSLAPTERLIVDRSTFAGLLPDSGVATLGVGAASWLDVSSLLHSLGDYPYGCTEQITSKALPLIYFDEAAAAMTRQGQLSPRKRVDRGIAEVLANQSSSGSFGLWRTGRDSLWLDAYVTDFLSRAQGRGYAVPAAAFGNALDSLRNSLNYAQGFEHGGVDVAYALMVLAREGLASIGDLRYYAMAKGEEFATPMAKAQLGAALAHYGEKALSDEMFRAALRQALRVQPESRDWRLDYGSDLRDGAAVLALASEVRSSVVGNSQRLMNVLARRQHLWTSPQEQAWLLMAAHALAETGGDGLHIDGEAWAQGLPLRFEAAVINDGRVVIENRSRLTKPAVLTTRGVPAKGRPADGEGYRLQREYFTLQGAPASPEAVRQNDRLAVVLTVQSEQVRRARLMIDDPLPAGFEIDNPNLVSSGNVSGLDWLDTHGEVAQVQFLDQRFTAAIDHDGKGRVRLAYIVRAVSPGRFHHPAAVVLDMYRPEFRAWTDSGRVEVSGALN